jgi:hypothetical protein
VAQTPIQVPRIDFKHPGVAPPAWTLQDPLEGDLRGQRKHSSTRGGGFELLVFTAVARWWCSTRASHQHRRRARAHVAVALNDAHSHGVNFDGAHTHAATVNTLPPFYALAFIEKL